MSAEEMPELTDRQAEVISRLPKSKPEIAEQLNIEPTTVEYHLNAIQDKGVEIEYDREVNKWFVVDERGEKLRRISTKHKGTKTRQANKLIMAEETHLLNRLERSEPLKAQPQESEDSETFVGVLSDLHFGDLVENEYGDVIYNTETAKQEVKTFAQRCLYWRNRQDTDFEDMSLFLLGDIATNEGIYEGQVYDLETYMADQVTDSVQSMFDLLTTFAEAFETLTVRCVLGNHGDVRASGSSEQANVDLIIYRWLDDALRREGYENVDIRIAEATHHLNTEIRGWKYHLRHGQDGKTHVDDTRSSESEWRGWREQHRFDVAVRGHFHNPAYDKVLSKYPVLTCPSAKPGDEWIERMGSPDVSNFRDIGWCFGVSDKRPMTFKRLIDNA